MSDEFVEVTSEGWGSRIMESIKGILVGIVLFVAAFPLLFLNEGCAVKMSRSLDEGLASCVSVSADKSEAANDGKLIHFSAEATTTDSVQDDVFKVTANCIKLSRDVQMYQWEETKESKSKKKLGGGKETITTYEYDKGWHSGRIDSSDFEKSSEYQNPALPYDGSSFQAKMVTAGAFQLNPTLINAIKGGSSVKLTEDILRSLPEDLKKKGVKLVGNAIYVGKDSASPQLGDLKISFSQVVPANVSIYAKQVGTQLEPFATKAGNPLIRLDMGTKTKEEMFTAAQAENDMKTWIIRLVGFLMMLFGIFLVLRPISVLGDVVPFIGDVVGGLLFVAAGAAAAGLSLITIAVAWVFYRPLIGVPLLILGIGGIVFAVIVLRKKKTPPAPEGEAF